MPKPTETCECGHKKLQHSYYTDGIKKYDFGRCSAQIVFPPSMYKQYERNHCKCTKYVPKGKETVLYGQEEYWKGSKQTEGEYSRLLKKGKEIVKTYTEAEFRKAIANPRNKGKIIEFDEAAGLLIKRKGKESAGTPDDAAIGDKIEEAASTTPSPLQPLTLILSPQEIAERLGWQSHCTMVLDESGRCKGELKTWIDELSDTENQLCWTCPKCEADYEFLSVGDKLLLNECEKCRKLESEHHDMGKLGVLFGSINTEEQKAFVKKALKESREAHNIHSKERELHEFKPVLATVKAIRQVGEKIELTLER